VTSAPTFGAAPRVTTLLVDADGCTLRGHYPHGQWWQGHPDERVGGAKVPLAPAPVGLHPESVFARKPWEK